MLLVVVLALALGAGMAGAKKKKKKHKAKKWDSTITLTRTTENQFTGSVGSKLSACRGERVVTLYYTDPNTGETRPLSVQRTDDAGHYQVDLPTRAYPGGYMAIADARQVRAMKAKQTCKGVTSVPLTV